MIKTEQLMINERSFIRTWSDEGKKIQRDGVTYDEAIDPAEFNRTYTETEEYVEISTEQAFTELMEALNYEEN